MAPQTKTIVMVAYTYYPWDPRVRREAETLAHLGHDVAIVCAQDAGQPKEERIGGLSVHRVRLSIRKGSTLRYLHQYVMFFALAAMAIRRIRKRRDLAAVHAHSLPDFIAFVGLTTRLRGIPLVLDLHEAMPEIYRARFPRAVLGPRLAAAAESISCLIADRVVTVNETIRDLLVSRGVPPERLLVIYNSPDFVTPEQSVQPPHTSGLHLVYAGTVDTERDLSTLVRAIGELQSTGPTTLVIYGKGPPEHRADLEGLVEGLGLRQHVTFGGTLPPDRVLAHLAPANVGVVTYVRNPITEVGLPNKVFEFIVLDKPLVLPDLRAMRRAFEGAALFYEPGDASGLANRIREAARGGPHIDEMRIRARAVYEGARWDVQALRLATLYTAVSVRAARRRNTRRGR